MHRIVENPQHHAYIVFGSTAHDLCAERSGNVFVVQMDQGLRVDDVRDLHQYAFQSVGTEERKIVLGMPRITTQAQHALLKMMEDAEPGVYFFLCLPQGTELLGTLLSRCYSIDYHPAGQDAGASQSLQFAEFVSSSVKDRLAHIDALWDEGESVRHGSVLRLLHDFEQYIHRCIAEGAPDPVSINRCRQAAHHLRAGVYDGALHKDTLYGVAFACPTVLPKTEDA